MASHTARTVSTEKQHENSADLRTRLETFNNPSSDRDYTIRIRIPEFSCLCPNTGQPDFATLHLEYVAETLCIELKSLKNYVWGFRDLGAFHEAVTNRIVADLVGVLSPRYLRLAAKFNVRGGIYTTVVVEHRADGWAPQYPSFHDNKAPG